MSAGKQKTPQPFSSLSSIVSNLVRAAIGGNHQDVPDEDLDKYVADMIMKSTNNTHQSFDDNYTPDGTSGGDKARLASGVVVSRSDSNGLKTNKRFLSSIIKSTDDHNQALIRAEEKKAAEMAKELIADLDRRAEGRKRGFQGKESRRDEKSSLGRMRMDEIDRSVSPNQPRSRSRSKSPPPVVKDKNEVKVRGRGSRKYDANQAPSSSTGSRLGSKMDKYFEEGYDPLLDTHADGESGIKVKHKKRGKDRKSKESTDRSRKRHKKHKSERSSKSGRHHDPDSDDNDERESSGRHHTGHHESESRRRRHHSDSSEDEKSRSRTNRTSRSPSPKRSRRRKESSKSERASREEGSNRERHSSSRRQAQYSDSDGDHGGAAHSRRKRTRSKSRSRSRSRSRTPPSSIPVQPKPTSREWDLHKINKGAIGAHLLNINRTNSS